MQIFAGTLNHVTFRYGEVAPFLSSRFANQYLPIVTIIVTFSEVPDLPSPWRDLDTTCAQVRRLSA